MRNEARPEKEDFTLNNCVSADWPSAAWLSRNVNNGKLSSSSLCHCTHSFTKTAAATVTEHSSSSTMALPPWPLCQRLLDYGPPIVPLGYLSSVHLSGAYLEFIESFIKSFIKSTGNFKHNRKYTIAYKTDSGQSVRYYYNFIWLDSPLLSQKSLLMWW